MPMTANGTSGSSACSAASTHASATALHSRSVTSIGARPSTSRAAMRRNSRRLNRRSPARRWLDVGAPLQRLHRGVDELVAAVLAGELVVVAERLDEPGLVEQAVAQAVGSIRGAGTRARPRRWSRGTSAPRPTTGSGLRRAAAAGGAPSRDRASSESQSRITGSSSWSTRDVRLNPLVSSRSAVRVCSASTNPNAAKSFLGRLARSTARGPPACRGAARRTSRSWIARTVA